MNRRIITTDVTEEDKKIETSLRPQLLSEYIGQERIKSTLKIFIEHDAKKDTTTATTETVDVGAS